MSVAFGSKADMAYCNAHVRLWPKADIPSCTAHVRYWGFSGRFLHLLQWRTAFLHFSALKKAPG